MLFYLIKKHTKSHLHHILLKKKSIKQQIFLVKEVLSDEKDNKVHHFYICISPKSDHFIPYLR